MFSTGYFLFPTICSILSVLLCLLMHSSDEHLFGCALLTWLFFSTLKYFSHLPSDLLLHNDRNDYRSDQNRKHNIISILHHVSLKIVIFGNDHNINEFGLEFNSLWWLVFQSKMEKRKNQNLCIRPSCNISSVREKQILIFENYSFNFQLKTWHSIQYEILLLWISHGKDLGTIVMYNSEKTWNK